MATFKREHLGRGGRHPQPTGAGESGLKSKQGGGGDGLFNVRCNIKYLFAYLLLLVWALQRSKVTVPLHHGRANIVFRQILS